MDWKWVTVDSGANEIVDTQLTVDDPLALMKLVGHSVGMDTYSRGHGHMHAQFMMELGWLGVRAVPRSGGTPDGSE